MQLWIRDLGAAGLGQDNRVINADELPYLREAAGRLKLTPARVAGAVDQVERARMLALGNVNPQLFVSTLLLELEETLNKMV